MWRKALAISLAILVVMTVGRLFIYGSAGQPEVAAAPAISGKLTDGVTIANFDWRKGGLAGGVALVKFTVRNGNTVPVKDVAVTCWFDGASGTNLSHADVTLYDVLLPGETRVFPERNLGRIDQQAADAHCDVVSAKG